MEFLKNVLSEVAELVPGELAVWRRCLLLEESPRPLDVAFPDRAGHLFDEGHVRLGPSLLLFVGEAFLGNGRLGRPIVGVAVHFEESHDGSKGRAEGREGDAAEAEQPLGHRFAFLFRAGVGAEQGSEEGKRTLGRPGRAEDEELLFILPRGKEDGPVEPADILVPRIFSRLAEKGLEAGDGEKRLSVLVEGEWNVEGRG